jgi:hypothetical protein
VQATAAVPSRISRSDCRFQNARAFRRALQPGQGILHAFAVHGKLLHSGAIMGAESQGSMALPYARRRRRGRAPPCTLTPWCGRIPLPGTGPLRKSTAPRKRNMIAWRRRLIPRVMQCPRHAVGLDRGQKVQRRSQRMCRAICPLKRRLTAARSCSLRAGRFFRISPPSATSLHSPMRRGRWAARRRSLRELFLACRIGLPRRNMRS